ncbi:MAG TPA: fibronectin type III domain-containing protein [Pilimelia sp.]|nr:fibronectin type III domain-containing protein [Pilimelia sp.]
MSRWWKVLVAFAAAVSLVAPGGLPATAAPPAGGMPAGALNTLFNTYGNTSGRWSGADSTGSVLLPDGRVAWLFSDTFLGAVNPDFSRPRTAPFINNSMVVQDGTELVATLHGGTTSAPESLVKAAQSGEFYWVGDGTVEGGVLRVLYNRYRRTGTGGLDVALAGTALATFDLPGLTLRSLTELPLGSTVGWGAAILEDGAYTYVYGTEGTDDGTKFAHLARVPAGGLTGAWQFWTGSGWSGTASASARLMSGVGTAFAVQKVNGQYVVVTQETGLIFHPGFVAYTSASPTGPYTGPVSLFTAPEPQPGSPLIAYDSRLHPELAQPGKLLVSYNVNSLQSDDVYADARIYRPRFVDVTWPLPSPDPSTLPAAPPNLTATADDAGNAHLQWQAPAGTGLRYWVYQRDVTAGQTHFARHPASTAETSADVGLLRDGHTYEFKVTAANAVGEGPASAVASVTPRVPRLPAPTGVRATADDAGAVTVAWNTVPGAWNYEVFRRDVTAGETGFTLVTRPGGGETSLRVEWLESGHEYEFYVTATNGAGASPPSAPVRATAHYDPPAAPSGLTATTLSDGTIRLAWTASGPNVWYWVYQRDVTAGETEFTQLSLPVDGTTLTAGYLSHDHEYEFKVTAINRGGESGPSNVARATARYPAPGAPANLRATAGDGEVTLTWNGLGTDFWYWVYQRDVTAGETEFTRLPLPIAGGTTMTAGYLANGHTYEFKVTGINQAGEGPASNLVRATPMAPLPAKPTGLTATANTNGTITLDWSAPGPNLWYWVYQRDITTGGAWQKLALPVTTGTAFTAGLLTHNHTYEFKVSAINATGEGPTSDPARATSRYAPPAAPTNLRGRSAGDGTIDLDWDGPAGLYYWVYFRDVTAGQTGFTRSGYPTDRTDATVGTLRHGHVYEFKVTAENQGGEGPASATIQVTSVGGLPAPPSNLTASAGDGQATLRWTASPSPGVLYVVYQRDATAGQSWQKLPLPVSGTTMTAGYLVNGHTYEFKVTATNAAGGSAASNVASARPLPPLPAPPTGLTASAGDGRVTLRWTASPSPNVWYWVEYRASGGSWQRLEFPVSTCCTHTVSYLLNGTTYDFRLRSTNVAGDSAPSNVASARPMPPFPQPPTGLTATPSGDTAVKLTWQASPTPRVYYWVYYRLRGASAWTRLQYPVDGTTLTVSYLSPKQTYEFHVRATNLAGTSAASNTASAYLAVTPPSQVTGLRTVPHQANSQIRLLWNATSRATGYSVDARQCGASRWNIVGIMITSTSWVYPSAWGACWEFRVVADRFGVLGPFSGLRKAYSTANDYPYPNAVTWLHDPWYFVFRQCTSFAAWRINKYHVSNFTGFWRQPQFGHWWHAYNWDTAADRSGVRRSGTPAVGAIAQWNYSPYGHVAFVAAVDGAQVLVEEYNMSVEHGYSNRWIPASSVDNYLHFEEW